MPRIEVELIKDVEGYPTTATIKKRNRTLTAKFYNENKFILEGQGLPSNAEILKLIYPVPYEPQFKIPEPLQVVSTVGGKTILLDDMEDLLKWWQVAGTVSLDNTFAYGGDQSLQIFCAAANTVGSGTRMFPLPPSRKVQLECLWTVDDYTRLDGLRFELNILTGSERFNPTILYDGVDQTWQVYENAGYAVFHTLPQQYEVAAVVGGSWNSFKMGIDLASRKYTSFSANDLKIDLNQYEIWNAASVADINSRLSLTVDNVAGQNVNAWFDNVILTEVT